MSKEYFFKYIDKPPKGIRHKRIVWVGVKNAVHQGTLLTNGKTLMEDIFHENVFPCLINWENDAGEQNYAEVITTNNRAKKTY